MLILSRKSNEKIVIGSNAEVTITVVRVSHGCVRLGIKAPDNMKIIRQELIDVPKDNQCKGQGCHY